MKVGRNAKNNPSPLPGKEAAKPAEGHKRQPKPFIFINIFITQPTCRLSVRLVAALS